MIWPFRRWHRHKWLLAGTRDNYRQVQFWCSTCKKSSPWLCTTTAEQAVLKQPHDLAMKRPDDPALSEQNCLHTIWWKFQDLLSDDSRGFDLMNKVDDWLDGQDPERVVALGCDDDYFMSSTIVLVEGSQVEPPVYMGVNLFFIPQNGKEPTNLFLYPGHLQELYEATGKLLKRCRKLQKLEDKHQKQRDKQIKKMIKHPDPYLEL